MSVTSVPPAAPLYCVRGQANGNLSPVYSYPYPLQMGTVRVADVGSSVASLDATPRHPPRAREGPWRFVASSVQLYNLCKWMPKALATELGARTVASRRCAVPTWHAVPAGGWCCRRQPAPCTPPSSSVTPRCFKVTMLKASTRCLAHALLARAPGSHSGLVVTGPGLQFLNWSCRRQPSYRLAASPLSRHPKGGPRSILESLVRALCH